MTRLTTLNFDNPVGQAFWILRVIFTVAPILSGLDKFFNVMVNWTDYLAPWIPNLIHVSPQTFMYGAGTIEICAGILVGLWPQYFAYVLTLWRKANTYAENVSMTRCAAFFFLTRPHVNSANPTCTNNPRSAA